MILTIDFPNLFGLIFGLANQKIKIKEMKVFHNWFHVNLEPIVVKVFTRNNHDKKKNFKN